MSVNTSEEYLDELLEAIEPIIKMGEPQPQVIPPVEEVVMDEIITEEVVAEKVADIEEAVIPAQDYGQESSVSDLLASLAEEDADIMDESGMSEEDVESMLNAANSQSVVEDTVSYDEDVKELLKQFTDDEDLSDIQDILDKNDNGEALDNSMLELPDVEVFQLEEENEDADDETGKKKSNPIGKIIGGFSALFKKRKDKKSKVTEKETATEEVPIVVEEEAEEAEYESITDAGLEFADMDGVDFEELLGEDVEDLVFDEDLSDIEQLLTGGAFAEAGQEEKADEKVNVQPSGKKNAKERKSKDKKSKEKGNKKQTKKEKKESFFTKVLNALTEEIDEPAKASNGVPEAGETGVTQENLEILKELSAEDRKKAKAAAKAEKKNKKAEKNGKKSSKKAEGNEEDNGNEADDKNAKKAKKAKKKREKKEKPRKVEEIKEPTKPEKKLPKKRVRSIFVLCFSILAAVLILQSVVSKSDNLKEAELAYNTGDYATCFANLETVERNEEEEDLYQKSLIIMSVQRKWDAYNNFTAMGNRLEALNSLLEGVAEYRNWEETALEWGVHAQITVIYQDMLEALQGYGLSQADVDEILAYESKVTYTKRLDSIVNGTPFVIEEMSESMVTDEPQPLQDVLPGEEDFLPEDTTLINEPSAITELPEEKPVEVQDQDTQSSGETVVVGSTPVVTGGQNVGSGNTNLSVEVNGQNAVVGIN